MTQGMSQMALTSGLTGDGSGKWTFTFFWGTLFPASLRDLLRFNITSFRWVTANSWILW